MSPILESWQGVGHPVIGMVHLRPLPCSPRFAGDLSSVAPEVHARWVAFDR